MGRRVLRGHIWDYSVCLCPIKGTPDLNELMMALLALINKLDEKIIVHALDLQLNSRLSSVLSFLYFSALINV